MCDRTRIEEAKRNYNLSITVAMLFLGLFFMAVDSRTSERGIITLWGWLGVILVALSSIPLVIQDSEDRKKEREKYGQKR